MADCIEKLVNARIGDYVLVREIGRGTHSSLFQAADPRGGRMVVIKVLHVSAASGPDATTPEAAHEPARVQEARLAREARALAHLSHPNILTIYETGEHDGFPFLVMEYLYGHPLRQILDRKSLSLEEAAGILEQLAGAVDAVHAQEILHRDIRPSNVMILHDGRVKLVDFGLARQPGDTTVTLMGERVGEPAYMAPEQLHNKPACPASDLWALGVLLYEMLAGEPPFQGANFTMVAHQVLREQPAPVPGASAAVQAVVGRALEKDPEKRYRRAGEMAAALRKAIAASPAPRPTEPRDTAVGMSRLAAKPITLAGAGALGLAACVTVGVYLSRPAPRISVPTAAAATLPAPLPAPPTQPSPPLVPTPVPAAAGPYRQGLSPFLGTVPPGAAASGPSQPGSDAAKTPPKRAKPRRAESPNPSDKSGSAAVPSSVSAEPPGLPQPSPGPK